MSLLSDRIHKARLAAGVSQSAIAVAVGVSSVAVNRWENGYSKNMKMRHLFTTARFLKCDVEWLATGRIPRASGIKSDSAARRSADEMRLIANYRALSKDERKVILKMLAAFAERNSEEA